MFVMPNFVLLEMGRGPALFQLTAGLIMLQAFLPTMFTLNYYYL